MGVLVTFTAGMAFWITAYSFGVKSFDAFMVTIGMTLVAITISAARPLIDQLLNRDAPAGPGD
jgi:hypothetical protein